jgi:hypothetical protein
MRPILAVSMILLVAWNSVLGGMDALVLCLHPTGLAHIEVAENETHHMSSECSYSTLDDGESPCTDLILESVSFGPLRLSGTDSEIKPSLLASREPRHLPNVVLPLEAYSVLSTPPRGPPVVEPTSQLIRRIVILRL